MHLRRAKGKWLGWIGWRTHCLWKCFICETLKWHKMEIRPNNNIQPDGVYFIFYTSFIIHRIHHVNIQCSNVLISFYDFHWRVTIFECNILCMILDKFIVMLHRWWWWYVCIWATFSIRCIFAAICVCVCVFECGLVWLIINNWPTNMSYEIYESQTQCTLLSAQWRLSMFWLNVKKFAGFWMFEMFKFHFLAFIYNCIIQFACTNAHIHPYIECDIKW